MEILSCCWFLSLVLKSTSVVLILVNLIWISEMVTVATSPRPSSADSSREINTDTEYLQIAKKGGGHKGTEVK